MNDAENPYRSPEAAIVVPTVEVPRPPVYTAIALFCWALGAFFGLAEALILYGITFRVGWDRAIALPDFGRGLLPILATLPLCLVCYAAAGWLLWARRGRPGLLLCLAAFAMSGLAYLSYSSMIANRAPRRGPALEAPSLGRTSTAPFLSDLA